ncbi:MAG: hypothetical protein IJH70_03685, partial [Oscillospiraceae bacterium]|nr:hypothetical protein [Oscillospiraceae bacterium]
SPILHPKSVLLRGNIAWFLKNRRFTPASVRRFSTHADPQIFSLSSIDEPRSYLIGKPFRLISF